MARTPDPAVRTALLEAAAELLASGGPDALSIRKVAATVGTSTMAVYTHFGSKDDLVREVVKEAFRRLRAEMDAVAHTDDPVLDLAGAADAYRRNALANAHLFRVMFERNPLALTDPSELEAAGNRVEVGMDAFGALVEAVARCVDAGQLHGDPARLALQFWATAHGAVSLEVAGFIGDDAEATYRAAVTATYLGMSRA